jgi:hypothetical protein
MALLFIRYFNSKNSMERIDHFMDCDEIQEIEEDSKDLPVGTMKMEDCSFAWETVKAADHNLRLIRLHNKAKKVP